MKHFEIGVPPQHQHSTGVESNRVRRYYLPPDTQAVRDRAAIRGTNSHLAPSSRRWVD
jgi:hypothetical protein